MNREVAAVILQEFEQHRSPAPASTNKAWAWKANTIRFPESFCMWCGAAMRSNRIWLLDEYKMRLMGRVKVSSGKVVAEKPTHPHAIDSKICFGKATDAYQALFLAWDRNSMYWSAFAEPSKLAYYQQLAKKRPSEEHKNYVASAKMWHDWLADVFDHVCGDSKVVGGLSAEMTRATKATEVAKPAVDNAPIFGTRAIVEPPRAEQPDNTPIFGVRADRIFD